MIGKFLELEITEFEYKHDRRPSAETISNVSQTLKHVEIINVSEYHLQSCSN